MTIDPNNAPPLPTVAVVESLLFVADAPVSVQQLAEAIQCKTSEIEYALEALAEEYKDRGIRLQRHKNQVQLTSAPDTALYVERFLGLSLSSRLSPAALEALAIIAYKQPITRAEIEAIRGVSSDGVLRNLMSKGLVEELGRLETVGHPFIFGTTFEFLQHFGLNSLEELPVLEFEEEQMHPSSDEGEAQPPVDEQPEPQPETSG
jgi:segregation and condensation protein B